MFQRLSQKETAIGNFRQKETYGLSALMESDFFSNLLPYEKKILADHAEIIALPKGDVLFSPGDKAERIYLLSSGILRIFKPLDGGTDEEIAYFTPGDLIGDFDFARGARYNAQAEALENSSLVMFPRYGLTMDSFAQEMPGIAARLLLNSAAMVTERIKSTRKLIAENISLVRELHRKAYEDPGTGLWKYTFLADETDRILEEPMALIMIKPDRFKVLVDSLGHAAGDKAMLQIARVLKSFPYRLGRGWALRFRSNETGILINKCSAAEAESLAHSLSQAISALAPIPLATSDVSSHAAFSFSASIAWGIWPDDNRDWQTLTEGLYDLLMEVWKDGGDKIVRYKGGC